MHIFLLAVVLLILGYCFYGLFVEKVLGINSKRLTPAKRLQDGVDFVPMHPAKIFLIQFLNEKISLDMYNTYHEKLRKCFI